MEIRYTADDHSLHVSLFLSLVQRVWPRDYDAYFAQQALHRTLNITAWDGDNLVGCVRVLSDGYFFGTIPEILVDPDYQGKGIGRRLMELAWEHSPTSLFLGAQPGNEGFFEKLGYERSMGLIRKAKTPAQADLQHDLPHDLAAGDHSQRVPVVAESVKPAACARARLSI